MIFSMRQRLRFYWRYLRGKTPWDTGIVPPEIVTLVPRLNPGRALDLGCGTGTTTIYLAQQGWRAEGVDYVGAAITKAKRKASAAAVADRARFYVGSVTRLGFIHPGIDLFVDVGCFHSLGEAGQREYAAEVARLAAPGAVMALYAFLPRLMNGRLIGAAPETVTALFAPVFEVESATIGTDSGSGHQSAWYLLRSHILAHQP
ncbi:hypothetical protein ANRL4_04104 [Anaerolineae bacterium]|nr:hypothetical protein ANRL4_04104 [Anaerolineae bacterium]